MSLSSSITCRPLSLELHELPAKVWSSLLLCSIYDLIARMIRQITSYLGHGKRPTRRIAIGDSIALGIGRALRCATDARVLALSDEVLRRMGSAAGYDEVVISVGSNDSANPDLAGTVAAIRAKVEGGARVVWIVPQPVWFPDAAAIVQAEAARNGDGTVLPSTLGPDGVHPLYPAAATLVQGEFMHLLTAVQKPSEAERDTPERGAG